MKIGLLATGTELITGDILNSNGQFIAKNLYDNDYALGLQITASDEQNEIEQALRWLLTEHEVVIITGGLGPTTDDRTRFALAAVINQPLVFFDACWERIVSRLNHYNVVVSDNNRQQCLFPASAELMINMNGTADGCKVLYENKIIYLLPGPPNECLPMFEQLILPDVLQHFPKETLYKRKWRLFNVSESEIATKLEALLAHTKVTTGYRIDYPYLEFKISTAEQNPAWLTQIEGFLQPYLLADSYRPASDILKEQLTTLPASLLIIDKATGGYLDMAIRSRDNYNKLIYSQQEGLNEADFFAVIEVQGLQEYWLKNEQATMTELYISLRQANRQETKQLTLPYRPVRIVKYATEVIANQILAWLFTNRPGI